MTPEERAKLESELAESGDIVTPEELAELSKPISPEESDQLERELAELELAQQTAEEGNSQAQLDDLLAILERETPDQHNKASITKEELREMHEKLVELGQVVTLEELTELFEPISPEVEPNNKAAVTNIIENKLSLLKKQSALDKVEAPKQEVIRPTKPPSSQLKEPAYEGVKPVRKQAAEVPKQEGVSSTEAPSKELGFWASLIKRVKEAFNGFANIIGLGSKEKPTPVDATPVDATSVDATAIPDTTRQINVILGEKPATAAPNFTAVKVMKVEAKILRDNIVDMRQQFVHNHKELWRQHDEKALQRRQDHQKPSVTKLVHLKDAQADQKHVMKVAEREAKKYVIGQDATPDKIKRKAQELIRSADAEIAKRSSSQKPEAVRPPERDAPSSTSDSSPSP